MISVRPPPTLVDRVFATRFHGRGGQGVVTAAELPQTAPRYRCGAIEMVSEGI